MKIGRNDPCHCGSGKKYKKCHLAQDQAETRASRPRLVERGDQSFLVNGEVNDESLEMAEDYFAEKDAGRGPAQQMMDFAQPLIDESDGSTEALNKALSLAMVFWNLAVTPEEDRETAITGALLKDADADVRSTFQAMAKVMIARHEAMFPELHGRG